MTWRTIGASGGYPAWLRSLKRSHGVYAIRRRGWLSTTVLYVGESHTGNLYKTITRHFQRWGRGKKFWRGAYAPEQTDPGHTYDRSDELEVAVQVARTPAAALRLQATWIARLQPRDNRAGVPDEDVPF